MRHTNDLDSIDALGANPERIQAFTGDLLSETEDQVLQAIVAEAARDLGTPMALVNLVLEQIQFFKAHHGLPSDLVAARGTHRDVSFCQFVVRDGKPFEVTDAESDERVPKHLVRHYGIRSYLGMPIIANETIVGSLCVIDTKPRSFTDVERDNLRQLASLVNSRIRELEKKDQASSPPSRPADPIAALQELKNQLIPMAEEVQIGRVSGQAVAAFLRLMDHAVDNPTFPRAIIRQTLNAAREAMQNIHDRFYGIDMSLNQAQTTLPVLEKNLQSDHTKIYETTRDVCTQLQPQLQYLLPPKWIKPPKTDYSANVSNSQYRATLLATLLSLEKAAESLSAPVELQVEIRSLEQEIELTLWLTPRNQADLSQIARNLTQQLGPSHPIIIRAADDDLCLRLPKK